MRNHSGFGFRSAMSIALIALVSIPVLADSPRVHFDHPSLVGCRDITTSAKDEILPGEKLVEATIRWSVRIHNGSDRDVEQVLIQIYGPNRVMRIIDFDPKNILESEYASDIEVTETVENTTSRGISTGSGINIPHKEISVQVTPSGEMKKTSRQSMIQKGLKIPAKRLVIASGTIFDGYGVFFKIKHSEQGSLEGFTQLRVVFAVPQDWQMERMFVVSEAQVRESFVFSERVKDCCRKVSQLTLVDADDPEAYRLAHQPHKTSQVKETKPEPIRPLSGAISFLRNAFKSD